MSEWERIQRRYHHTEAPALEPHRHSVGSAAPEPFGVQTPAGILALQRHAGNQATTPCCVPQRG